MSYMKKIVDWINSHKIITICVALFLFVVQPIVVHLMFKTQAVTPFWENTWNAGDLLGYIAGFEAFLGTVFLGVVAARQNDKAIDLNERMMQIEEKRDLLERQPSLKISSWLIDYVGYKEIDGEEYDARVYKGIFDAMDADEEKSKYRFLRVSLNLINASRTNIEFRIIGLSVVGKGPEYHLEYSTSSINAKHDFYNLCPNATASVAFLLEDDVNLKSMYKQCRLELNLSNIISETYIQRIEFSMFGVTPDYFRIFPENNEIIPFKPNKIDE